MLKPVSEGLNVGAEVLRYQGLFYSSGHSGNRHRYGRAGRAELPVIPDHGGDVDVGYPYRRAGRGDNVSLYGAYSHVPVIQRSVDVFV